MYFFLVGSLDTTVTVLNGQYHTIRSPGYPSNYSNSISKSWLLINSDPVGIFTVTVRDINITSGDYLEIRDGNSSNSDLIGRFDGTRKPSLIFTSSKYVWILFRTDSFNVNKGFEVIVRAGK